MWHDYGLGYGFGIGALLLWVLVLAGLALLVYVAIRLTGHGGRDTSARPPVAPPPVDAPPPGPAVSSARRILEERYARGEIDTEEFTERLRTLEGR